ncbi:hypothetical protein M432DRAFT_598196 [Thermoascus aurantiacus ATCC 26904]
MGAAILSRKTQKILRRIWHFVPRFMRVFGSRILFEVGKRLYARETLSPLVQRLPLGLYIKRCTRSQENEPNALKLLEQYTSVPAPLLIDTFQDKESTFLDHDQIKGTDGQRGISPDVLCRARAVFRRFEKDR